MNRYQPPAFGLKLATAALLATLLSACAGPQSYVALIPSPDGSTGKVFVQGQQGQHLLTRAQQGVLLDGSKLPFDVSPEQLQRHFGHAMRARPTLPEQFLLYFETGGSELTAESKALLQRIVQAALARTSLDMSVIGHSDTQGAADANEALALVRAKAIAEQLRGLGLANTTMVIESHGERNLLVPTPDETPEPRNRRVEITLR
jgi:adhesin transport system outer membrane protein